MAARLAVPTARADGVNSPISALAAVPPELAGKLTGLALPDADPHDQLYRAQVLLADRKFADAKAASEDFSYASDSNHEWLQGAQLLAMLEPKAAK